MTNPTTTCIRFSKDWTVCGEEVKGGNTISPEHYRQSFFEENLGKREVIAGHIKLLPEPLCRVCAAGMNEALGIKT